MALEQRLAAIPFGALIGGPMNAAIEAQASAALSTVEFIKSVGFNQNTNKVNNITFIYGEGGAEQSLQVPLLTVLPIPFIRIDDMTIQFKASMSQSTETSESKTTSVGKEAKIEASASYWFVKAKMSGSVSSKKDTTSTRDSKYAVEYTIDVNVHAVQDDMPSGMAKVLNILAESIERQQEKGSSAKPH